MKTAYEQAAEALYQGPHESFVAKRRELAAELKGNGDRTSAARLAKLPRPSLTAWAVNQLWWQAHADFDALFATAEQVRQGNAPAGRAHRQAVSKLAALAKQLLEASGHGSNEATLRRITMTLSALAAAGEWKQEPPGMLAKDLDPPGFEAFGMTAGAPTEGKTEAVASIEKGNANKRADAEAKAQSDAEAKRARQLEREAAEAEKKRLAEQRIKYAAERIELESALRAAKTAVTVQERERDGAEKALKLVERTVELARAKVEEAEAALVAHSNGE
ncbi:MAG: hypothetical protein ABIQ16_03435 [Polyangiaceae bacterium]